MTAAELHNQFKVENVTNTVEYKAILTHARTILFRPQPGVDATALTNNEGAMRGWHACLEYLSKLEAPKPEPEKTEAKPKYADPGK